MRTYSLLASLIGAVALLSFAGPSQAEERRASFMKTTDAAGKVKKRSYRKGAPRVRGYVARRGGYSYRPEDVIDTYGLSRSLYGSTNTYRNPWGDRQTTGGPFDHGFIFDSGIGPHGGNSPYLH